MKRYVFNNFLKSVRLSQLLTWLGSWFHHLRPITLKALDANIFNFILGSNSLLPYCHCKVLAFYLQVILLKDFSDTMVQHSLGI